MFHQSNRCEGNLSNQGYDEELRAERAYVDGLYARLDRERDEARVRYDHALGEPGTTLVERDADVRVRARETVRLNVADNGLCFGRLDGLPGEHRYIGRIGLTDEAGSPMLVDWRAPAAQAFYRATPAAGRRDQPAASPHPGPAVSGCTTRCSAGRGDRRRCRPTTP